jgi:hypothetical protein
MERNKKQCSDVLRSYIEEQPIFRAWAESSWSKDPRVLELDQTSLTIRRTLMSTSPTKKASSFIHILTHSRAVRSNKQHAELYLSENTILYFGDDKISNLRLWRCSCEGRWSEKSLKLEASTLLKSNIYSTCKTRLNPSMVAKKMYIKCDLIWRTKSPWHQ